jgi:hypothetical protein
MQKERYQASGHQFRAYIDGAVLLRDSTFHGSDGFSSSEFECQWFAEFSRGKLSKILLSTPESEGSLTAQSVL